jgi:quinol monooxygenase YgiN
MVGLTMSSASALAQSWSVTYFETETAAAREAHVTSDHMKNFRNTLMPIIGAMYDERIYTLVEIN